MTALATKMTEAHEQRTTLHIVECVPSHEPRETDPHYHVFNETRARLKKLGLLKCWIGNEDCAGQIELHHDKVEFSLANGVDISKFHEAFPEFTGKTDLEFFEWIEGEAGLLPLCRLHHIGVLGTHVLPGPLWLPQKFWKMGMVAPAHTVPQGSTNKRIKGQPVPPASATAPDADTQ